MSKKNKVKRFAFGCIENPLTGVWRVFSDSLGNVYLNSQKILGNEVHLSLHASGKVHFKITEETGNIVYKDLNPTYFDNRGFYWGPQIVYFNREVNLPAPKPDTKSKIHWLGNPGIDELFIIRFLFLDAKDSIIMEDSTILFEFDNVKTQGKKMKLIVVKSRRKMDESDKNFFYIEPEKLEYRIGDILPDRLDIIKISKDSAPEEFEKPGLIVHVSFKVIVNAYPSTYIDAL